MTTVNTYLTFNGNCMEAFNFYKSIFGSEFSSVNKFGEMPPSENTEHQVAESDKDKIMHISLPISKETVLMGSDAAGSWANAYKEGNNFALSLLVETKEEANRVFNGLSSGGKVTVPLAPTFWAPYFGMFTDKYGINWMVSVEHKEME